MRTLLECLKDPLTQKFFSVVLLCDLALQIADGMAYLESGLAELHRRGVVHRDLAARNILVFAKDNASSSFLFCA